MSISKELMSRCGGVCELCGKESELDTYTLSPCEADNCEVAICSECEQNIQNPSENAEYFRCLNDAIWSPFPSVQVTAYRLLKQLNTPWAEDTLSSIYLEPEVASWVDGESESSEATRDSNGTVLNEGDSVTIIKDLEVKGAGFTAKRGTVVKNIHLTNNPEQIEGRVNGVRIVLLSKFLKKA